MRTAIYALKDKLTNVYLAPFHATHDIAAVRGIVSLANDPQAKAQGNNVAAYPAEYELYRMAHFDDVDGVIIAAPVLLARVDQLAADKRYFPDAS